MHPATGLLLLLAIIPCFCQRPFYAGMRPVGYPDIQDASSSSSDLSARFGDDLPPQLNGDTSYANRLDKLPVDQQPSWYLNRKQYEEAMKNPQTYPQRPSSFNENKL